MTITRITMNSSPPKQEAAPGARRASCAGQHVRVGNGRPTFPGLVRTPGPPRLPATRVLRAALHLESCAQRMRPEPSRCELPAARSMVVAGAGTRSAQVGCDHPMPAWLLHGCAARHRSCRLILQRHLRMDTMAVPSMQQDLAWLRDRSEDLPSASLSLRRARRGQRTRVRRAEKSGHVEDADRFGASARPAGSGSEPGSGGSGGAALGCGGSSGPAL
jgi:hypothetical protein